jgi:hypothetical protein
MSSNKNVSAHFQHNLLPFTITMVAALSLQEVLLERPIGDYSDSLDQNQLIQIRKAWLGKGHSLLLVSCFFSSFTNLEELKCKF